MNTRGGRASDCRRRPSRFEIDKGRASRLGATNGSKLLIGNDLKPGSPYGGEFEPSMGFEPHLRLAP